MVSAISIPLNWTSGVLQFVLKLIECAQLLTLNKVYSSSGMRCGIILVVLLAPLVLQASPLHDTTSQKKHAQSLGAALVDFHQLEGYSVGAIQVAGIEFAHDDWKSTIVARWFVDIVDVGLLFSLDLWTD